MGRNDPGADAQKSRVAWSCRYAGFEGESELLYELYKRGLAQPEVGPSLHAGDGMLMFWHT